MEQKDYNMDVKLTQFSHGGGCGCKIAPAILSEILAKSPVRLPNPNLLVGTESSDDAAVYRLNDYQAIVATTDFFMPIVDDPFDFGRIAATNAISDIYAMGAQPIFALAIVGMPIDKLPIETIQGILAGGESVCASVGIPIAGGHSIDSPEPIYGLVALGIVHPDKVKRNDAAKAGDVLILGKGIGIGIMSAALKKGELSDEGYQQMVASTTQLNTPGSVLVDMPGVHALTDVTGFALLGHLLEICRGSRLSAEIEFAKLPILPVALELAKKGYAPGAASRNWASYGDNVVLPENMPEWQKNVLCDPQTSGGLLVSCSPEAADSVLELFHKQGFEYATIVGKLKFGESEISVF
ncbi:selenide, water dikinase SelD [Sulfurirhabdus autotrophica]|uniref:Selenide, water dikinase n=1 Tax=Sulfurirhabdus autotrophica TaxID=1706046 RepID=A0A4R3YJ28_9PROT|nr:selenide, water dikinase SelD [Sulfurirhabdus autotrophica]TCV90703.1 selenophosphate synthase [Sulfurirhabdus autotrophica]